MTYYLLLVDRIKHTLHSSFHIFDCLINNFVKTKIYALLISQLFKASGVGTIAGSYVLDGIFQRNCKVRITREGEQVFEGEHASLKRFKDDVKEVKAGYECGLVFDGFNDVKEEDKVEAYIMVEVPR